MDVHVNDVYSTRFDDKAARFVNVYNMLHAEQQTNQTDHINRHIIPIFSKDVDIISYIKTPAWDYLCSPLAAPGYRRLGSPEAGKASTTLHTNVQTKEYCNTQKENGNDYHKRYQNLKQFIKYQVNSQET